LLADSKETVIAAATFSDRHELSCDEVTAREQSGFINVMNEQRYAVADKQFDFERSPQRLRLSSLHLHRSS